MSKSFELEVIQETQEAKQNPKKALSIVSLVFGILGVVGGCCPGAVLFAITGLITGILGHIKRETARGLRIAGLATSGVGTTAGILIIVFICFAPTLIGPLIAQYLPQIITTIIITVLKDILKDYASDILSDLLKSITGATG
jgi:hypothetical protein